MQRGAVTERARRSRAPKRTQRERLVDAMIELCGQLGCQAVSIAQVSAHAGVSSATFYEQFADKEDCLLAAYREASERALTRMRRVLGEREWTGATRVALAELLASVESETDAARVMFVEAPAGGPRLRADVARVLEDFEQQAEALLDWAPADAQTLDLPAQALVGAVRTVVARHLRTQSEDRLPALAEDMLGWMGSYAVRASDGRWSVGPRALLDPAPRSPAAGGTKGAVMTPELARLPRGRHGLPPAAVARSQRTRIIHAVAQVTMEKGYASTTVADVVAAAGVARDAFYRHFSDKEQAFLEAQNYPTQYILDTCVASYFSAREWPERVWRGLATLLELIAENPTLSHLRLVECYAAGAAAVRRAEEITRSFTIFLEEGYGYCPDARALPRLSSQAIAGAVFEVIRREVAGGRIADLPRRLAQLTYISIAPFTGPREAIRLVERMSD